MFSQQGNKFFIIQHESVISNTLEAGLYKVQFDPLQGF